MKNKIILIILRFLYFIRLKQNPSKDRVVIISGKKILVGKYTYGYESTKIFSWGEEIEIKFGRFCSIASGLKLFCGGNHNISFISTFPFGHIFKNFFDISKKKSIVLSNGNITIGNDVWIGRDVTIMSGVILGDGCVIAANSHIVKNVEPYSVYGGNPAKFIKYRFPNEFIEILLEIKWWDCEDYVIQKIHNILLDKPDRHTYNKLKKIIMSNSSN